MRNLYDKDWFDVEDAIANAIAFLESIGYKSGDVHDDLMSAHQTLLALDCTLDATSDNVPFAGEYRMSECEAKRYIFAD